MVGVIVCAILSLIPTIGWAGSLSVRSLSCVLVNVQLIHSLKNKEKGSTLLQIFRLVTVTLGLIGRATHLNRLLILAEVAVEDGME